MSTSTCPATDWGCRLDHHLDRNTRSARGSTARTGLFDALVGLCEAEQMSCPVCQKRKPRRACPARGADICTVCCGTKRLVEIRCPPDCRYLATARVHPAAVVRRQQEQDLRVFLPTVHDLSDEQAHLLWFILSRIRAFRPEGILSLTDDEVAESAATLASTFETATRGLIYEHRPASLAAQRLSAAIKEALGALAEARRPGFERDAAVVLRRIERGAFDARKQFGGDVTAYLGLVERMARPSEEAPGTGQPSAGEPASGLILS